MNIAFLIPTYNRPRSLLEIVQKIHKLGDVYILDDCSDKDLTFLAKYNVKYFSNEVHKGKERFFETVTDLFYLMANTEYDYYFFMPDDLIPVDDFHIKAIYTWNKIDDTRKICLNIYLDQSRYKKACWTDFIPRDKGAAWLTNWVDMCFMCEAKFFKMIGYKIPKPSINWKVTPSMSSGVGRYISKYLVYRKMLRIYQVKSSLLKSSPESFNSQMHPNRNTNHLIYKEII